MTIIERIMSRFSRAPAPLPAIDQTSHVDRMEANVRRLAALDREVAREQQRIAWAVSSWSCDCVSGRMRAAFQPRVVGRDAAAWLPGLNAAEIMTISRAGVFEIGHHLFGAHTLPGVRPVQPLQPCPLVWPRPVLTQEQLAAATGGGPRRR